LLGHKQRPSAPDDRENANQLGQLVLTRTVNLEAITIDDISTLHANKKTAKQFREFKAHLATVAQTIGPVANAKVRAERLKSKANEIIDAWHAYQATLPTRIVNALIDVADLHTPELLTTSLGASTLHYLPVGKGIGVTFIAYGAVRIYKEFQERQHSPYRYLSTIAAAQDPRTLLAYPLALRSHARTLTTSAKKTT